MKPRCPLVRIADQARKASVNMLRATHQLRRSAVACQACLLQAHCIQRMAFNAEIDALITEINEQWQSMEEMVEARKRVSRLTAKPLALREPTKGNEIASQRTLAKTFRSDKDCLKDGRG